MKKLISLTLVALLLVSCSPGGGGISDDVWDEYMKAYKVFDNDSAVFWGAENLTN